MSLLMWLKTIGLQGRASQSMLPANLAYFLLSILVVLMFKNVAQALRHPLRSVPGPWYATWTRLPLKLAIMSGRRMNHVHALHQKYGPYVLISPSEMAVSSIEGYTKIHRVGPGFDKPVWYRQMVFWDRPILFSMGPAKAHSQRRRLFARAFSKTNLRQQWETIVHNKVQLAVSRIKSEALSSTADVFKWWTFMATDVSVHLMFGESFQTLETGQVSEYTRALQKQVKGTGIGTELPIIRILGGILPFKFLKESFRGAMTLLKYGKTAVKNSRTNGDTKNMFANIIQSAEKGESLDDHDINIEATGFIIAGTDTTAVTMTYLTWAVLSHPEWQALLEEEVRNLPEDFHDVELEGLPVLNAIIEETLRLYGAAPGGLPREVPPGGADLGGYLIPEGFTVTTQSYTYHRDATIFPDPDKFNPARFLDTSPFNNQDVKISPEAQSVLHPFGAGTRVCIGVHLARMELRLATTELFRSCAGIKLAPSTTDATMEMENYFLITPKGHACEVMLS